MPVYVDVLARLDERAAAATAKQIERQFSTVGVTVGKTTGNSLTDAIDKATNRAGAGLTTQFSGYGTQAGKSFGSSFDSSVARSIPASGGFNTAVNGYTGVATKAGTAAGRALGTAFTLAAGGLIGAAGLTLFKGFERYQSIDAAKNRLENLNRTLQGTGRAGLDVGAVMDTVTKAVTDTPFALDQAFSVATRALASNTGDLQRFMTVVTDAAGFAGAGVDEIGNAFLKVANTGKVSMEEIGNELRNIPILPWLQQQLGVTGGELQKMISDGKVGLNDLMTAVENNASGFAKASGDTIAGAMQNMQTAVARIGANLLGSVFGKPTEDGNDLVDVLKTVRMRLDEVNAWITANQGKIREVFLDAVDVAKDLASAIGSVLDYLDRVGIGVDDVVQAFVAWKAIQGVSALTTALGGISATLSTDLPGAADKGAKGITAALSRVAVPAWLTFLAMENGPEIEQAIADSIPGGNTFNNLPTTADAGKAARDWVDRNIFGEGTPNPAADFGQQQLSPAGTRESGGVPQFQPGQGGPAGASAERRGNQPFRFDAPAGAAPAGNPILDPTGSGAGSGPRLPDAPVVPYDTTLPPGIPGMPADPSVFSAESSFLDARHALAEKRARLTQLEASVDATDEDRLNARNDVIAEERDFQAAEMRMHEARQNQLEKLTKQVDGATSSLSQLGAELDKDFGISKGFGGIVENFVKAAGNILAAPFLQALGLIENANPNEGSGLMGIAAANGAFGQQYTPGYLSAMQATTTAGAGGGVPGFSGGAAMGGNVGAMMALAQASSGNVKYAPASDLINGLADCSGSISDLVEVLNTGQTNSGRLFTTTNFASDAEAAKLGFLPGYMPGALNVGVNPYPGMSGHMAATLPNGVNFEGGGGTGGGAQYGGNAAGALDPQFEKQYYRPVGVSPGGVASPGLTIPQSPTYNTNPGLTPGWSGPVTGAPTGGGMYPGIGQPSAGIAAPQGAPIGGGIAYPSQGGNSGNIMGGLALDGAMAATAGLDMMMPGAGAAAKIGIQLANRTIGYAAQNAGIAASGILETLSLGDNPKGSLGGGWIGKIAGGIAGAAPALPNLAGGQKAPLPGGEGQQPGAANNTTNINVKNEKATEDQTGKVIAEHQAAMQAPPGRQP